MKKKGNQRGSPAMVPVSANIFLGITVHSFNILYS